jgi:hypothetical protein
MFISETDETIRELLIIYGKIDPLEIDISFDRPDKEWVSGVSKPTVNVYLYNIEENTELKNTNARIARRGANNTAILSKPEVRIDLSYNVTVFASEISDEHRLLSRVIWTLMKYPLLPPDVLQGTMVGQTIQASTAHPEQTKVKPSDYWSVIDNDLRASVDYKLIARLDLEDEITTGLTLGSRCTFGATNGAKDKFESNPMTIAGRIHSLDDIDMGVANAEIKVLERALDTTSNHGGLYVLRGLQTGTYTFVINVEGYEETRKQIVVPSQHYDIGI